MINPFSLQTRIARLQQEVLTPLYTMHPGQAETDHPSLLAATGKVIETHRPFLEEVSRSSLLAGIFAIVKLFGGAEQLSREDFARFTGYVNEGGLQAMVAMLLAADMEQAFLDELRGLPAHVRANASLMLAKSAELHEEFIAGYFRDTYGSQDAAPPKLQENRQRSTTFIRRLATLAENGT